MLRIPGILLICHYYCNGRQECSRACVGSMEERKEEEVGAGEIYIFIVGGNARVKLDLDAK